MRGKRFFLNLIFSIINVILSIYYAVKITQTKCRILRSKYLMLLVSLNSTIYSYIIKLDNFY